MGGAGRYVANSAGVVHVAKRSADAEPEAEADAFYGTYGYGLPYTYGAYTGYAGYAGYPYTYGAYPYATYALPTATAQVSPSASLTTLGLADPSIPAVGGAYAGAGRYVANSAGVVHVAKRSADAEP